MAWSEGETGASIDARCQQQIRLRPEHAAIVGTSGKLSYRELDVLAERYASALRRRTDTQSSDQQRAALLLSHDGQVVAAVLAALRCGMAVVTLNVSDPPARLRQIREEIDPDVLITDDPHLGRGRAAGFEDGQTLILSAIRGDDQGPGPPPVSRPDDVAFLISTSGSSGRPKVVMQTHRNVLHNVLRYTNGLQIQSDDRIALMASLSGGQGLATTWTALLNGATLCLFPIAERGVTGLAPWLADNGVTVLDTIPSVLRNFALTLRGERIPGVRLVRLASEGALRSDFEAFRDHFGDECVLASVLASSEAGIIAQGFLRPADRVSGARLPVGRPAEGVEVSLIGEDGTPARNGDPGEIVVQGRYLSPGYWRDVPLTAQRFEGSGGSRRFRTGDLATRSSDDVLTVVGRADKQVKVRGHRLQLEEVEAAIASHADVAAVAVVLHTTARGDARLTAYLAPAPGRTPTAGQLRQSLRVLLPAHAVPAAFVLVAAMPVNAHGKIDRERLAELGEAGVTPTDGDRPESETEELVASLWAEAFERREVDRDEAFLDLGGDSLLAAQIAAAVHEIFGVDLDLGVFAADPTVAALAALIEQRRNTASSEDPPPVRGTEHVAPLSFAQGRFWPPSGVDDDPRSHVLMPTDIRGPLNVDALQQSVEQIVRRHEILRTTFRLDRGKPVAIVGPVGPVPLTVDDLRASPDQNTRIEEITRSELLVPYDLLLGPLFRLRLLRLEDEHYRLLRMSHHLIHDAASWKIFFSELALCYDALIEGKPSPLPARATFQYSDYAVWERACVNSPLRGHEAEIARWRAILDSPPPALELPFLRSEPQPDAPPAEPLWWGLPAEQAGQLDRIGRRSGATFFMTRLAVFTASLAIETGATDFLIGAVLSTRTREEWQRVFGPFINFRPLRFRFDPERSFDDWLGEVRRVVIDTSANASLPWEALRWSLSDDGVNFQPPSVMFVPAGPAEAMRFGGLELEPLPRPCPESRIPVFRVVVNRSSETERCAADFDSRIHDERGVQTFLSRMGELAAAIGGESDRSLHALT